MKQKIELEQFGDNEFRVVKLTNRIEPMVGSTIDKRYVKELIDRKSSIAVVITPAKQMVPLAQGEK